MRIKPADLEVVQAVLAGNITLPYAAMHLSPVQKVVLAHTALTAGNFTQTAWRTQLGELLTELALGSVIPEGGWPRDETGSIRQDYVELFNQGTTEEYNLVPTSKRLGLHRSDRGGHRLEIVPNNQILDLLKNNRHRQAALALFQAANAKVNARRAAGRRYYD